MNKNNPWKEFNLWLFDGSLRSDIPDEICKKLNNIALLRMFQYIEGITPVLNKIYNKYNLANINTKEFCKTLKEIIIYKKINKYDFKYFKIKKIDKNLNSIKNKLIYFKTYEVEQLLNYLYSDEENNTEILEYLDLIKHKSKKTKNISNKYTFNKWKKNFNKEV